MYVVDDDIVGSIVAVAFKIHGHLGSNQMLKNVGILNQKKMEMLRIIKLLIVKMRMFDIHKDIWSLGSPFIL